MKNQKRQTLKVLETKKLFYRKYPYKVACLISGGHYITTYGTSFAISKAIEWERKYESNRWGKTSYSNSVKISELEEFCDRVRPFVEDENVQIRAEGRHFNLFCADKNTYAKIAQSLKTWVTEVTEPRTDKDLEYLLNNKSIKVLVDMLPYEKYKFKIVLKSTIKADQRQKLLNWISKYPDDIKVSGNTVTWLASQNKYVQDPFMYVSNDGIRTLVELYTGAYKSRTEEFVLRSTLYEA